MELKVIWNWENFRKCSARLTFFFTPNSVCFFLSLSLTHSICRNPQISWEKHTMPRHNEHAVDIRLLA